MAEKYICFSIYQ